MAEEQKAPESGTGNGQGSPPAASVPDGWEGEFTPERAKKTIENIREAESKLKAELKTIKEQLAQASLTAEQRTAQELKQWQERAIAAEQKVGASAKKVLIYKEAAKLGFADPEDAGRFLDQAVEGDGIGAALKQLAESKPYLLGKGPAEEKAKGSEPAAAPKISTGNPASAGGLTLEQAKRLSTADYLKNPDAFHELARRVAKK